MYVCMYVCTYVCTYICMYVCMYVRTHSKCTLHTHTTSDVYTLKVHNETHPTLSIYRDNPCMQTNTHTQRDTHLNVLHQHQSVPHEVTAKLLQVVLLQSNKHTAIDVGLNEAFVQVLHSTGLQELLHHFLWSPVYRDMCNMHASCK